MILLAIWTVLFVSFSSAEFYQITADDFYFYSVWANTTTSFNDDWSNVYCVYIDSNCSSNCWSFVIDWVSHSLRGSWNRWPVFCWRWNTLSISSSIHYFYYIFSPNFFNNFCSKYTSLECQFEYNLIPIEEVNQAYCESNNLCPVWWTPSDCPNVWVSNLFINDIFHPWAFNVIMNIPSEIEWDYAYTNSWNNINIDVVWYNQDEEYIQSWIDTNNYKPTSSDFTNIFSNFSQFWGLLIATLFVILVFYFIKKMF